MAGRAVAPDQRAVSVWCSGLLKRGRWRGNGRRRARSRREPDASAHGARDGEPEHRAQSAATGKSPKAKGHHTAHVRMAAVSYLIPEADNPRIISGSQRARHESRLCRRHRCGLHRGPGCAGDFKSAPKDAEIREGTHLRMNGPKKVMEEIKAHKRSMMVGITGLMKKDQSPRAAVGRCRRGERACVEGRRYFVLKYAAIVEPSNAVSCTT